MKYFKQRRSTSIYPKHIIPYPQYNLIEQTEMLSHSGLVLIRHVESDEVCRIENSNILHPDCIKIQSDHLRDLSNNLLGVFKVGDICYGIVKEHRQAYCSPWECGSMGLAPTNDKCFKDINRGYYFIPVNDLLKCYLPKVEEQQCHFMIFHTPTKCNFWHISIRLLNDKNQEISTIDLSTKKKHKIWKSAKDFLIQDIITYDIESYSELPKDIYSKPL